MNETHIIKLPKRTGRAEICEEESRIVVKLRFDKYGDFGDTAEISQWLTPVLERYDSDPRPVVMDNPTTGEVAVVSGDASESNVTLFVPNGGGQ